MRRMPAAYLVAIDQGTTGTTVLVVNTRGRVVGRAAAAFPQYYPQPGWVEHRPDEILRTTWRVVRAALRDNRIRPPQVAAIGITNQRETVVAWDRHTGRPCANAIVWQCRRTAPLCERLTARGALPLIRRTTGLVLDAYFSATKMRWLLDHVPQLRARARRGAIAFGTIDSWLLWHLTGGRVHATDYTNASRTLLYNIRAHRWDPQLLQLFGVPASTLPAVQPCRGLFGHTAGGARSPLPAGIPILAMAGDQQAAMVGHGCITPGTAKNTYGTGCFLLLHTGTRCVSSRQGLITTLAYGRGRPAYALEGSMFMAGAAVQWLRDGLGIIRTAHETAAIARRVRSTDGVYLVPAFVGLGAPHWDMHARGAILGMTRGTTRAMIVRATLEALAYQTRDVVEAMHAESGLRVRALHVDGGAAQNNWLMQFQADMLGIPIIRQPMVDNTAKGAALLAGLELGWWREAQLGRSTQGRPRTFHPRMRLAERQRRYAGWQDAVARVRTHDTR